MKYRYLSADMEELPTGNSWNSPRARVCRQGRTGLTWCKVRATIAVVPSAIALALIFGTLGAISGVISAFAYCIQTWQE